MIRCVMSCIEKDEELMDIQGGISLTSGILNALGNGAKIILEIGRSLGSAIRRSFSGNVC